FTFDKNQKYAIIGESGSGKSTVLKMILGRLIPKKGAVLVDDKPLDTAKDIDFSKEIAYVSQDNYLFNLSIRDNITLGEDISDEKIMDAIREVRVDHLVNSLENGLDTFVGALGGQLSGGEKQRICLARALVRDLPVIILDEATSAVDNETRQEIEDIILSKDNKTIIMISHHLEESTKAKLDKIYEIKKIS
ncbi:MAG: ABC transporter ATP-binding protein, partial [Tissierellia bacterium]|nr:ABC transporter ATP-binding protein [Tissierellia bacterium]